MTRKAGKPDVGTRVKSLRARGRKAGAVKGGALKKAAGILPPPTIDLAPVGGSPPPR